MNRILGILSVPFQTFWHLTLVKKIVVVIVLGIIGVQVGNYLQARSKKNGIETAPAEITSIVEVVSESGTIAAAGRSDIYSKATGIVQEVFVQNGDAVVAGQELFTVKSTATEQEKHAAYANYLSALAGANASRSTADSLRADMYTKWDEFRNLATNDTYETSEGEPREENRTAAEFHIERDEWFAAEKKYKDQQTAIAASRASVSSTWDLYQATQDATVTARSDGIVANLSVATGDRVHAFQSSIATPGISPVLTIADLSNISVVVEIGQTDIALISPGQKAMLYPDAYDNKEYDGTVLRVDEIGDDSTGVVQYSVYLEITNPDNTLKSGMTFDADIVTNKLDNVLTVPNGAIKPHEGGKAVRIIGENNEPEFVPVLIGIKGERRTQILSGIEEGQEVIVSLSNENVPRSGGLFGG